MLDSFEAGVVLKGSEVKSLRLGNANLQDSYAYLKEGEVWLSGMHISPYEQANILNHDPLRERKLLLHKKEIRKLVGKTSEKGLTLIPLKVYSKMAGQKWRLGFVAENEAMINVLPLRSARPSVNCDDSFQTESFEITG